VICHGRRLELRTGAILINSFFPSSYFSYSFSLFSWQISGIEMKGAQFSDVVEPVIEVEVRFEKASIDGDGEAGVGIFAGIWKQNLART